MARRAIYRGATEVVYHVSEGQDVRPNADRIAARLVEAPDEVIERYAKALDEFRLARASLAKYYDAAPPSPSAHG